MFQKSIDKVDFAPRDTVSFNFDQEDPAQVLKALTGGVGPDRVIDAVGSMLSVRIVVPPPKKSRHNRRASLNTSQNKSRQRRIREERIGPGDAPSQVFDCALDSVAKAFTVCLTNVYPETAKTYPVGKSMNKNITLRGGNCNHLKYVAKLL